MGSNKTPGRVTLKTMLGWSGEGGEVPGGEPSATAAATAAVLKKGGDATVDLGALMRTKKKAQLLGTSGGLTAHSSLALPGKWGPCALMQGSPALPAGVVAAANPVYSPDDSLAKAASKLQSLKALRASTAAPAAPRLQLGAAAAAPARGPPSPSPGPAAPAPQACESPRIGTAVAAEAQPAAPEAEGSQQRLGGEDSGELAALSALQKRRKSLAPATAGKQRYGEWFAGDDKELEGALHEYNRSAPAASPRMTRAQRRKSMAVDRSLALEPGLARAALLGGEEQGKEGEQEQAQQAAKRAGAGRRKSMAAAKEVPVQLPVAPTPPELEQRQELGGASVADEVAAMNAEMCAALSGLVGEDSPDKASRGDRRSLRDKLLESWDGKTYYERLLQMSSQERELAGAGRAAQPAAAKQPHKPGAAGGSAAKTPGRAPAAKATPPVAAARPAAAAPKPAPAPLEVPAASSSAAAKALLTPNTQRRKLNELTGQLQLLKVSTRNRGTLQQAAAAGGVQRSGTPPLEAAAPLAPASAASKTPRSRSRSGSPEAEAQPAAVTAPSAQASAEPAAAAAKAGSKRGSRRGASPPTEASAAAAGSSGDEQEGRATTAAGQKGSSAELAAAYDLLNAALADKDGLAQQLAAVQAELAAERVARAAEQRELAQAREELAQAQAERKEEAAALKAAEQRAKQLARELAEAQAAAAAAAAAADKAAEAEARCGEAEKALSAILKAANGGLKAVAAGKEEAKALAEALRSCAPENAPAPAAPATSSGRPSRQSTGRQGWR